MSVYWKRIATRYLFLFSLIVLLCAGTTLQARADKTQAYAWGYNAFSALGDGTNTDKHLAASVFGMTNVKQISAGSDHSLAVKMDGTVWAWGYNRGGQLGDGTTIDRNTPVQVSGLSGAVQVAAGSFHSLALRSDGTVWAWGGNYTGQLGDGTTVNRSLPVQVSGITNAVQISIGSDHSLAITSEGVVWAWGYNKYGQLGDGTNTNRSTPVQASGLSGVAQVSGGRNHSLAFKLDGTVWAWGYNDRGQLGDGTTTNKNTPLQVAGLAGVTLVSGGANHSLAVKSDGTAWAWGGNYSGQLGDGTTVDETTPIQIAGLSSVKQISAGWYHTLAVKLDGTVWAWGYNGYGQLGDGTTTDRFTPTQATGLAGVAQPSAGRLHSLALGKVVTPALATTMSVAKRTLTAGLATVLEAKLTLTSAGTPLPGESVAFSIDGISVGSAYTDATGLASLPVTLSYPAGAHPYKALFAGSGVLHASSSSATLTLSTFTPVRGTVYAWGDNTYGALGTGYYYSANAPTPVKNLTKVVQVAEGNAHSLALKSDGTVWAWGNNGHGELGDGTYIAKSVSVQVVGLTGVVQIAGGANHSLALKSDGTVWAWGNNNWGQLGDGGKVYARNAPAQVAGVAGVVQIAGGGGFWGGYSLALKSDGTVLAWGNSGFDATYLASYTPVQLAGLTGIAQIAGGYDFSLALKSDGTVWALGYNHQGQLGDGTRTSKNTPVQVSGLGGVAYLSAGRSHSLALKSDGTVWAWGDNYYGELGDGTRVDRYSPVPIPGLSGVTSIAGGSEYYAGGYTLALKSDGTVWGWGRNNAGQLGNGTGGDGTGNFNTNTPVQALVLTGQTYVAAGLDHSLSLTAVPRNTITSTSSLKVTYGATTVLTGKLRLTGVVTLPMRTLVFSIDGVVVGTATTDASGTARLTLGSPIAPGVHSLDVAFAGDGNFNASGASGTIAVKAATTLSQKSVSGNMGSMVNLAATLTRTVGGVLLANKTVTFYVDGVSVGTATTDANGVAALSYTITQAAGKYALKVTFDGDNDYLASSFTRASLVVK